MQKDRKVTYPLSQRKQLKSVFIVAFFLLWALPSLAQTPKITSYADSTRIKIGARINYTVEVEVDSTAQVVFPQGQTFSPLEVTQSFDIDTIREEAKFNLIKKYGLTQWDSGQYTLPSQKVLIDGKQYLTDSVKVYVADVVVDTTKQKMFDIKPIIEVNKNYDGWWKYLLWGLGILLVIAAILYFFIFRKKKPTEEEKIAMLPAFDRAMLKLKELENSRYLIQSEHKKYYSELTDIVRSYLEEDAHVDALESTTSQLIEKLEMRRDAGNLELDEVTIDNFRRVLQTADLVKFAKAEPEMSKAEADRVAIENIVKQTREAIPEPTEEELLQQEEYLAELERKKRKKKIVIASVVGGLLLLISTGAVIAHYGFTYVKDSILGHPTRELVKTDWIQSDYGVPAMTLETPKVLKRTEIEIGKTEDGTSVKIPVFVYGNLIDHFYILASSVTLPQGQEPDLGKAAAANIKIWEDQGARNLLVKSEDFTTPQGVTGLKTYGRGDFKNPLTQKYQTNEYVLVHFNYNGGIQQVVMTYEVGDEYAEEIIGRVMNSITFKEGS